MSTGVLETFRRPRPRLRRSALGRAARAGPAGAGGSGDDPRRRPGSRRRIADRRRLGPAPGRRRGGQDRRRRPVRADRRRPGPPHRLCVGGRLHPRQAAGRRGARRDRWTLTIVLSEGTGTYSETVNVAGERFREQEKSVPAQQTLGSADIQNLRNLLTNDPMRAIQVLPGVTTGDDFRSEFAVRGSPFGRMNFTFDGIPTTFLLHTVQQVQDGGSIAMLNGDILDGITLMNGSYPQRYGNRLGAELDFQMREGSRDRTQTRVGVSGTDASIVVEGPLGRREGGLVAGVRAQELSRAAAEADYREETTTSGSASATCSRRWSTTSRRGSTRAQLVAGQSRLDQTSVTQPSTTWTTGRNRAALVNGAWRFTPRRGSSSPSASPSARSPSQPNVNPGASSSATVQARDITWRTDFVRPGRPRLVRGRRQIQSQHREKPDVLPARDRYRSPWSRTTPAHAVVGLRAGALGRPRPARAGGARVDHWSLTTTPTTRRGCRRSCGCTGPEAPRRHRHLPAVPRHRPRRPDVQRPSLTLRLARARVPRRPRPRAGARHVRAAGSSRSTTARSATCCGCRSRSCGSERRAG